MDLPHIERIREMVSFDLDPDFLRSVLISLAWEYNTLFEKVSAKEFLPLELKKEEYANNRGYCAVTALVKAAKQHGVPFNFRRVSCNGQMKLLLKAGRVVLIQEPMLTLGDAPRTSDYKKELASSYGVIRQLELDLRDQPNRILDWSGDVLAVLLHGSAGPSFTRRDRALGGVMLGVPNDAYTMWEVRLDLLQIAMFGEDASFTNKPVSDDASALQRDEVVVVPKRKIAATGTDE